MASSPTTAVARWAATSPTRSCGRTHAAPGSPRSTRIPSAGLTLPWRPSWRYTAPPSWPTQPPPSTPRSLRFGQGALVTPEVLIRVGLAVALDRAPDRVHLGHHHDDQGADDGDAGQHDDDGSEDRL